MKVLKINNKYHIEKEVDIYEKLEVGNYLLHYNEKTGNYYLEKIKDFVLPKKIYGNEEELVERYLKTFKHTKKNMGILLTGLKGSGKTLTAKLISKKANLPTIIITECFKGVAFKQFLQTLDQEVIIQIDEFEKVYSEDDDSKNQEEFLSILDGVFESKKLFVFTTNTMRINHFLKNRPNRIRYLRNFKGLDREVITAIIADNLEDDKLKGGLLEVLQILSSVSIDVLLHLIEEMNLYKETAKEAIKKLNVQLEHNMFDVRLYLKGKMYTTRVNYNPLDTKVISLSYRYYDERNSNYERYGYYEKNIEDLTFQNLEGEFEFRDRDGNKVIFTATQPFEFNI